MIVIFLRYLPLLLFVILLIVLYKWKTGKLVKEVKSQTLLPEETYDHVLRLLPPDEELSDTDKEHIQQFLEYKENYSKEAKPKLLK